MMAAEDQLGFTRIHGIEDINGKWVKYEDVEGIEKIGFGRTVCALCHADLAHGNHYNTCELTGIKTPECNCKEMSGFEILCTDDVFNFNPPSPEDSWICPAHGYKKR